MLKADKSLERPVSWGESKDKETTRLSFKYALSINGITQEGLFLIGSAIKEQPEKNVTFQLSWTAPGGEIYNLVRVDWRPLRPHCNKNKGPNRYRFIEISGSHVHSFELNKDSLENFRGNKNLPIAEPLEGDPDFNVLYTILSAKMAVSDTGFITEPEWEGRLL